MNPLAASALAAAAGLAALPAGGAGGAGGVAPQRYDLVVETGMPHLEENLRYAVTRERRCVDRQDLGRMFPVLGHVALQDCRLVRAAQQADGAVYRLACSGGHGTTGEARWAFGDASISGTLSVKLGGKNMTFYQRISGRALGACQAPWSPAPELSRSSPAIRPSHRAPAWRAPPADG